MKQRRRRRDRRGAAMVEMALVLPVFMMVLLGIIEFGRAMMVSQLVANASREGARMGIIEGKANADVTKYINSFLTASANVGAEDIAVTITVTPAPGNDACGNEIANAQRRDLVTVKVAVPFKSVRYMPGSHLDGKLLVGQSTMRHE